VVNQSLLVRFMPAAGATLVLGAVSATRSLGTIPRTIAITCVVATWATAALIRPTSLRTRSSVVAGIAAVTAAGQVEAGVPYGVLTALFLLGCLASLRSARAAATDAGSSAHHTAIRPLLVLTTAAAIVASGLIVGLPRLADYIERKIVGMLAGVGDEETAFSTRMILGATRGMLQSKAIVLRIDGKRPEYLRGAVYDSYGPPRWVTTEVGQRRELTPAPPSNDPDVTRITLVRGAPQGEDMRWFLPPGACDIGVASGAIEIDGFGVARRGTEPEPATITFRTSNCRTPRAPVAPPTPADLEVPAKIRASLTPIAAGWVTAARTDVEKLDAIQRELRRFEYSLAVPRDTGYDPVVDFVTIHRAGHCEMFASAMVLMARTQGIAARVVGGYRVSDVNPLTGQAVVRDRNAHAWVEAWVDGAWRGWDPTPASETFDFRAGLADHVGDFLSKMVDRFVIALVRLGPLGVTAFLIVVLGLLVLVRRIGLRLRARRRRRQRTEDSGRPLPCFEHLAEELAIAGHRRDESEPVEAFARRIETAAAPWARAASRALRDYASLRYGGIGDPRQVAEAVERAARAVRSDRA